MNADADLYRSCPTMMLIMATSTVKWILVPWPCENWHGGYRDPFNKSSSCPVCSPSQGNAKNGM
eukprot:scaffold1267_cov171-Amphora_coffeaeformis.AAC.16